MTTEQRVAAYRAGDFNVREIWIWANRFPEEVPTINGEFEWIARSLADSE